MFTPDGKDRPYMPRARVLVITWHFNIRIESAWHKYESCRNQKRKKKKMIECETKQNSRTVCHFPRKREFSRLFMFSFLRKWNLIEIVSTERITSHHSISLQRTRILSCLILLLHIHGNFPPSNSRQTIPFSHLNYASSWLIWEKKNSIQFNVNVYRFCCWYLFKRNDEYKQTPLQQWQPQQRKKKNQKFYICMCDENWL